MAKDNKTHICPWGALKLCTVSDDCPHAMAHPVELSCDTTACRSDYGQGKGILCIPIEEVTSGGE